MSKLLNSCLVLLPFALLSWVPSCVDQSPANPDPTTPPIITPLDTDCNDDYPDAATEIDSGFRCPPDHTDTTCPSHCCLPITDAGV